MKKIFFIPLLSIIFFLIILLFIYLFIKQKDYKKMVTITGGTYIQQSDVSDNFNITVKDESFSHTISDFQLAKYEVTYELWYEVYKWAESKGYKFTHKGREGHDGKAGEAPTKAKHEPVTLIDWNDAIVWCNAYSEMSGFNPCYTYSNSIIKDSTLANLNVCNNAVCNWNADGYRLPTEGEWQYAASNKGITPFNYASGAKSDYTDKKENIKVAWYRANAKASMHDVGSKQPNELGIYDMSGNVFEWIWDIYKASYPLDSQTNYRGADINSVLLLRRVIRGGSWYTGEDALQIGRRVPLASRAEGHDIGFRIARSIKN